MFETDSNVSSLRFIMVFIAILSTILVFGTWGYLCIITKVLIEVPNSVWILYSGTLGLSFGTKLIQNTTEK